MNVFAKTLILLILAICLVGCSSPFSRDDNNEQISKLNSRIATLNLSVAKLEMQNSNLQDRNDYLQEQVDLAKATGFISIEELKLMAQIIDTDNVTFSEGEQSELAGTLKRNLEALIEGREGITTAVVRKRKFVSKLFEMLVVVVQFFMYAVVIAGVILVGFLCWIGRNWADTATRVGGVIAVLLLYLASVVYDVSVSSLLLDMPAILPGDMQNVLIGFAPFIIGVIFAFYVRKSFTNDAGVERWNAVITTLLICMLIDTLMNMGIFVENREIPIANVAFSIGLLITLFLTYDEKNFQSDEDLESY